MNRPRKGEREGDRPLDDLTERPARGRRLHALTTAKALAAAACVLLPPLLLAVEAAAAESSGDPRLAADNAAGLEETEIFPPPLEDIGE